MHRVGAGAGLGADLVDQRGGQVLDQRRMGSHEGIPAGVVGLDQAGDVLARHLLHLVVHAAHQAGRRDQAEGLVEVVFLDAREAARGGFEGGELEGTDAAFDQAGGGRQAVFLVQGAEQPHVHVAVALDLGDLGVQVRARGDRLGIVVGHVDHDRDAAGGGRARGPAQAFLVGLAAGVHLAVDHAGNDPLPAGVDAVARRVGRADAARGDPAVPHGQPAVFHDTVRIDDIAAHHPIEIAHDPFHPMKNCRAV